MSGAELYTSTVRMVDAGTTADLGSLSGFIVIVNGRLWNVSYSFARFVANARDRNFTGSPLHLIYILDPHVVKFVSLPNSSPDRSSDIEPALSFRYQTNGFATLYKGVVMFEPRW